MPTEQKSIAQGDIVEGRVQGITNFGAFIELPGGLVGLVHISEIADTYVKDVKDFIQEGSTVKVKVLNVAGKKIGLSIKQASVATDQNTEKRSAGDTRRERDVNMQRPVNMNKSSSPHRSHANANKVNAAGPVSLDDKIAKFLKESDERMQPLKNKMETKKRNRNY